MRFVMFYHSLISDWNHGNAHFLRGVVTELLARGHEVTVFEPGDSWSVDNLVRDHGLEPLLDFQEYYPGLSSVRYSLAGLDLERELEDADVVLVHEWNDPELVRSIGRHRARGGSYRLFFHDTHHRMATDPQAMGGYEIDHYDGVLAFGEVIAELYRERGWRRQAWTWHEAADTRIFRPRKPEPRDGDVVWIGNWGDGERTEELQEFLFGPVTELGLRARIHGVRYPEDARRKLASAGIEYRGWVANFQAPEIFARFAATVHVPRRPYARTLPGIPTIRVFEALACGIPLVSAPWNDVEGLFRPGTDYLVARDGREMRQQLKLLLADRAAAAELARHGLETVFARHTCAHRVDELFTIIGEDKCRRVA
ncbi:MAG: glycosyltransferase [Deltaproteobacteria bacterium]|nr:glycosyltransferase [Deltaproteobacteria bacterium]